MEIFWKLCLTLGCTGRERCLTEGYRSIWKQMQLYDIDVQLSNAANALHKYSLKK